MDDANKVIKSPGIIHVKHSIRSACSERGRLQITTKLGRIDTLNPLDADKALLVAGSHGLLDRSWGSDPVTAKEEEGWPVMGFEGGDRDDDVDGGSDEPALLVFESIFLFLSFTNEPIFVNILF